jgi:hypothetical protein
MRRLILIAVSVFAALAGVAPAHAGLNLNLGNQNETFSAVRLADPAQGEDPCVV